MKTKLSEMSLEDRWVAGVLVVAVLVFGFALNHAYAKRAARAQGHSAQDTWPFNHLAGSTSPYLLQHAHNPVDWYPWGAEALEKAKRENKPIFLSVGYSACHWCHVMEREDFENEEIAKIMNENFVCIKVDREERPDIDDQYQLALQLITQRGGWPMSVWLTPDLKPFYGGTYYPAADFEPLLEKIGKLWRDDPGKIKTAAEQVSAKMREVTNSMTSKATAAIPSDVTEKATAALLSEFDKAHGGFGDRPKFPEAPRLLFLLDRYRATRRPDLPALLNKTLTAMACGGVYDQIGGGFHRYSTDAKWLVPHFEKMLYDQAQLAVVYLDAYDLTRNPFYKQVAQGTLDFVLREMTDPKTGGFYSTIDADSEGAEGKFYVWSPNQLKDALGEADAANFAKAYGVEATGNFEDDRSVLHLTAPLPAAQETVLAPLRERLRLAREKRIHPSIDDKIVTGWNGLMIAAFAQGFKATGDKRYADAATRAADFIEKTLTRSDGTLLRTARDGKAGTVSGFLDDYAFAAEGMLTLYEATGDKRRLKTADAEAQQMSKLFWNRDDHNGFVSHGPDGAPVSKTRAGEDNATPSPNGIAAQTLIRLAALPTVGDRPDTTAAYRRQQAAQTLQGFEPLLRRAPAAFPSLLVAYGMLHAPATHKP